MAPPLYFLPGKTAAEVQCNDGRLVAQQFDSLGLTREFADVVDSRDLLIADLSQSGPGGASGLLLGVKGPLAPANPRRWNYFPDYQDWSEQLPGQLWVGNDREEPPGASDLKRRRPQIGNTWAAPLFFETGDWWAIPICYSPDAAREIELPQQLRVPRDDQPDRQWVGDIRAEYRSIYERSEQAARWQYGDAPWDDDLMLTLALDLWAINYRVGPALLNHLGWFDRARAEMILSAALDKQHADTWVAALQKKTEDDPAADGTTSFPSTSAATTPAIDPAAANVTSPPV